MIYDVLIIGAGITGAMTAYALAKKNVSVAVAESGSDIASGATRANSAIIHAGYDAECGSLKALLNVRGCPMVEEISKKLGVHYNKCGSHVIAFSEKEREHLNMLLERGNTNGVPGLRIIEQGELRKMEPNVSKEAIASLWAPTAGIVCPYDLAIATCENAAINGTDFYFNFSVTDVEDENGVYLVRCGDKSIYAKYIVNAAGVNGDEIAEICGEHDFPVKIIPRRGEYMMLDKQMNGIVNSTLFVVPTDRGKGILVSPTVHQNVIIGPNAYKIDDKDDKSTTVAGIKEISDGAKRIIPELNLRTVITSFSGVRPTPNMYDFYIKPSEQLRGIVHAAGVESPGLASSPAVGEYVVNLLAKIGLKMSDRKNYIETRGINGNYIPFRELSDDEKSAAISRDPSFAKIICRCETITEGDILQAIRRPLGAKNLDAVKRRARAGMGRCQGGFCSPRVSELLASELNISLDEVTKFGGNSKILCGHTK